MMLRQFLLHYLSACCCICITTFCTAKVITLNDNGEVKEFTVADMLMETRPKEELLRMYPHMLPFDDLVDPKTKSFRYGFPLTGASMSAVIKSFDLFRKARPDENSAKKAEEQKKPAPTANGSVSEVLKNLFTVHVSHTHLSLHISCSNFSTNADSDQPVVFQFTDLFKEEFDFKKDLLDRIDDGLGNRGYNYLDIEREFLVGVWYSMEKEGYFNDKFDRAWSQVSRCSGKNPLCYWRRIFVILLSAIKMKVDQKSNIKITSAEKLFYDLDAVAASFWLAYCLVKVDRKDPEFRYFCPDPCRSNPCSSMSHSVIDSCKVTGKGIYSNEFTCDCVPGAKWSKDKLECQPYDLCKDSNACSRAGVKRCLYNPLTRESECQCKSGFMGDKCELERNACFERYNPGSVTGNWACNVEEGNTCQPVLGADIFACSCGRQWRSDPAWGDIVNCLKFSDACMRAVCEVGDCVSAVTGDETICQCPPSHYGSRCQFVYGSWSPWGPWSSCDPDCGHLRVRMRNRGCLASSCFGHSHETEWCDAFDCVPAEVAEFSLDRWRAASALRLFLVTIATTVAVALAALLILQLLLVAWLCNDRGALDARIFESRSIDEILAYQRVSCKHALLAKAGIKL